MIQNLTVGQVCLILKTLIRVSRSAFGCVNARWNTAQLAGRLLWDTITLGGGALERV